MSKQQTCPNGHPANSYANCFDDRCPYRNSNRYNPPVDREGPDPAWGPLPPVDK